MALPPPMKFPGDAFKGAMGDANALASALDRVQSKLAAFDRGAREDAIRGAKDPVKRKRLELELERDTLSQKAGLLEAEKKKRTEAASAVEKALKQQQADQVTARATELAGLKRLSDERNAKAKAQQASLVATAGHLKMVAGAYLALGVAAGRTALAGGALAMEALQFKEDTSFALKFMLGSGKAAETTFGTMASIANILGVNSAEAMEQFNKISSAGVRQGEAQQLVQLAQDFKKATGADVSGQLGKALMALKKGQGAPLNVASFDVLKDAGLSETRINDILAKKLGVTEKDDNKRAFKVQQVLAQQNLRGQRAIDFWGQVMLDATGKDKAGQLAQEKQNTTITGSLDKIQAKWTALWGAINASPAGKRLVTILQAVAGALDPSTESGKKLVGVLNKGAALAEKLFGAVSADDVVAAFDLVGEAIDTVLTAAEPLGEGLFAGLKSGFETVKKVFAAFDDGSQGPQDTAAAWRGVGEALGFVAAMVGGAVAGLLYINGKVLGFVAFLQGAGGLLGVALVDGFSNGIDGAKDRLIARVGALANLLPATIRKLLKIESPSKVMRQLGAYTAEGLAVGLDKGAPDVEASARTALVAPIDRSAQASALVAPVAPALSRPAQAAPTARAAPVLPPITINVYGAPGGDMEALKRLIQEASEELLQRIALELGART